MIGYLGGGAKDGGPGLSRRLGDAPLNLSEVKRVGMRFSVCSPGAKSTKRSHPYRFK